MAAPAAAAETKQKVEQIIRETIVKVNKWFNTATEEVESLTEELAHWRKHISSPLLLNVYLDLDAVGDNPTGRGGLLLERWKLLYDQSPALPSSVEVPTLYKKTVVLIRSLFTYLRLMPARRIVKDAQQHKITRAIRYALSKQEFNPPFPNGVACSECRFAALDTPNGRFSVHVIFRQDCDFKLHDDTLITSKFIIQDYMPEGKAGLAASSPTPIPGTNTLSIPQTVLSPPNSYQTGPTLGTSPHHTYMRNSNPIHSTSAPVHTSFLSNTPLGGGAYYRCSSLLTSIINALSPPSLGTTPPAASRRSADGSKSPPEMGKASPGSSPLDAKAHMSPRSTMLLEPHSPSFLTDPAFSSGGSADTDSEVGDFVKSCTDLPALKICANTPRPVIIVEAELDRLTAGVDKLRF